MKNKPDRHPNRLSRFDYSQNGGYFLTLCAKDRQPLFGHFPNACVGGGVLDAPRVFATRRGCRADASIGPYGRRDIGSHPNRKRAPRQGFGGVGASRPTVSTVYHPLAIIFSSAPSGARSTAIPNFFPTHNKSRPGCPPGGRFIVSSIPSACRPGIAKSAAVFNPRRFHRCWRCFRRGSRCRWPCGLRARSAARRYRQSPWFPGSWSGPGRL